MRVLFLGGSLVLTGHEASSAQPVEGNERLRSVIAEVDSPRSLANWLRQQGEHVVYKEVKITLDDLDAICPDLIVSYNYKYLLTTDVIRRVHGKAINLHISFLPYNKGYHPYVWSFLENTPKGVSIHYIDEGIDSGDIIVQEMIYIDEEKETLKSGYKQKKWRKRSKF